LGEWGERVGERGNGLAVAAERVDRGHGAQGAAETQELGLQLNVLIRKEGDVSVPLPIHATPF
jgi:hypothetical protein